MNGLPEGWEWSTVGQATGAVLGQSPPGTSYNSDGIGVPFFQGKAEFGAMTAEVRKWTTEPKKRASAGDVLLSVRAPVGATNFAPVDCSVGRGLAAIRAAGDMDQRYVFWFLRHSERRLAAMGTGSTFTAISGSQLKSFPIPVPPLTEQRHIVAAIEEHLSRLDAAEASILSASGALDPLLAESTRRLVLGTGVSNQLSFARRLADDAGWVWMRLDDVGELGRGKSKHRPRNDPSMYGGRYPFVQTGDVTRADGRLRSYSQTYNEFGLAQSRLWPSGTVVITIAANIAESAVLDFDACFPDSVVGLVPDAAIARPEWVEFFIRTAKANLERYAPATAQKNINLQVLREVLVPIPPLAVQDALLEALSSIESTAAYLRHATGRALSHSAALRRSVLAAAFTGRLVAQDPENEPASMLLERIANQRATSPQARGTKVAS